MNDIINEVNEIMRVTEERLNRIFGKPVKLHLSAVNEKSITEEIIKALICNAIGVSWRAVQSPVRKKELVAARQLYSYFCTQYLPEKTFNSIAFDLCYADHSSVSTGIQRLHGLLDSHDEFMTEKFTLIKFKLDGITTDQIPTPGA